MPWLGADPLPYDLDGWKTRLEELRREPDDAWRASAIRNAEASIAALEAPPLNSPVEAC